MALHNPNELFTAGKVNLHSPYFNNVLQYQQRKQAKDEALDKHFGNLPNTINEQGVRDIDIPVLHSQKDAIQKYYMENRDAIKKGNTPEAFNIGKMFREAQGTVQESKNRTKTADAISKLRGNPKYDYIFRDPTLIDKIASHDLSVVDPNSKGIDFNQITLPPAPFDSAKYINSIKIKPNPTAPEYKDIPGDKFNRLEITNKKFSPEDLNALHIHATTELANNPSFENEIKEHVQKDPAMAAQMADIFQKQYGHPITNEGDLATAYTLSRMDITPTQRTVKNTDAYNAEWTRRHNKIVADRVKKVAGESGTTVNDVYGKIEANQENADINTNYNGERIKAGRFNTLPNDAQQVLMKSFKESGHDVTAEDIYQVRIPNGDIVFYQTDDKGQPMPNEKLKIFTVSKVGTNLKAQQPGAAEKREVIAQGEPNKTKEKYPLPAGKPKTVKQNGFTYTYNSQTGEYE